MFLDVHRLEQASVLPLLRELLPVPQCPAPGLPSREGITTKAVPSFSCLLVGAAPLWVPLYAVLCTWEKDRKREGERKKNGGEGERRGGSENSYAGSCSPVRCCYQPNQNIPLNVLVFPEKSDSPEKTHLEYGHHCPMGWSSGRSKRRNMLSSSLRWGH